MADAVLRQMINDAPQQIEDIDSGINQVDSQLDELNDQITAMQGMASDIQAAIVDYLTNTKIPALSGLDAASVSYGPDFGTIDYDTGGVTDWVILDSTGNDVYEYLGLNWDGDTNIIKFVDDYAFANDYLTRPLDSGATYGLIPSRDSLDTAKGILEENKLKVDESQTVLEDYA